MKKINVYSSLLLAALFCSFINPFPAYCETDPALSNVIIIVPGMTQTVEIKQTALFPLGCPMFYIAVLGKGTLGISVKKDDVAGDTIFMLGVAVSGEVTVPVYRIGRSNGMIDQILEIDPYGFVLVYCGVAFSSNTPNYNSQFRVSLEP